jgi:hypothetical protein
MAKTVLGALMAAWWACGLACAAPFGNLTNDDFATRCNGPQGAIVVDDSAVRTSAARASAVRAQHSPDKLAHAANTVRRLQARGLVSARAEARFPRLIVHTSGGKMVLPDLVRAKSTGGIGDVSNQLTFEWQNWSSADKATLESYLTAAYAKARLVYGPPAFNNTVRIIRDDTITDIQGGTYDATLNEIRMPSLSGNLAEDTFILLQLVLRAFHDDAFLFYDAWEEGFVGAAATAIQVQPGVAPDFDPKDPGPFYALSVYEAENRPNLGNATFFPSGDFTGMLVWRIAMARAAWLKCWIEKDTFFSEFNAAYYNEFASSLPGDVPRLRELCASVVPTVEATPFHEWYVRQHVLNTAVRAGLKEYTWNIPLESSVALICEHYLTDTDGNEYARSGQARTVYWSYDFSVSLYAEEGNLIDISQRGDTPGEGFLIPTFFNIGGAQRITVQLDLNGLRSYYPYPYLVRGFDPGTNNLYGPILNTNTGTLDVVGGKGITGLGVSRGVWGAIITASDLSPLKLTATFTNSSAQTIRRQVNVGWDSYMVLLDGGRQSTLTHVYPKGLTGVRLISLPVTPIATGAADALGLPAADLLLARWDPAALPDGMYRIWPDCPPLEYGRGFWLKCLSDLNLTVTGIQASESDRIGVPLELGWNMIGSPRLNPVTVESLKVQVGADTPLAWMEAVSKRIVQQGVFAYDESSGYLPATELQPFAGYWVRALTSGGCRLLFEPVSAASAHVAQAASAASAQPAWKMPLTVQAGWIRSSAAYLGGARDASSATDALYDMQAPPAFGSTVELRFIRREGNRQVAYLTDVRDKDPRGQTWEVHVRSTLPDQTVRLSWPDLSGLPAEVRPWMVDPATGKRTYLRTTQCMDLPAAESGVDKTLYLEMTGPEASSLTVSALAAQALSGSVRLSYALSRSAAVSVRILNIAGRPVRQVIAGVDQDAGTHSAAWNLAGDSGARVPAGLYLCEVVARADDGQSVRAVRAVRVVR